MDTTKKNLRYAESAQMRSAKLPETVLRDIGSNSSEKENFPILPVLPGRGECMAYAGFGAMYVSIATSPIWWGNDAQIVFGAILAGTAACYGILRGIVQYRWARHCRRCRERDKEENIPVRFKPEYVSADRVRGKRLGYITPEMICAAARRTGGKW